MNARLLLVAAPLALLPLSLGTSGCAAVNSASTSCTATPFISPTSVTLDHASANNAATFTTGTHYQGNCAIPQFVIGYTWVVSDTMDSTITTALGSTATATCTNTAIAPITVSTTIASYPAGSYPNGPPTYVPSGLPSATLLCE